MYPVRMAVFVVGGLVLAAPAFAQEKKAEPKPPTVSPAIQTREQIVDGFLKKYDKNKDGYIDRDEMPAELRGRFDELDTDRDGKLDREDLLDHVGILRRFEKQELRQDTREQRQGDRERRREQRAERRQKNEQPAGSLVQPALMGVAMRFATSDEPGRTAVQMVYEVLRAMDQNKDGDIDHAEWQAALDLVREHRVNGLLRRQSKDGKIAKEDARGAVRQHFSEWDLNKDGFVDRNELRRAFNLKPAAPKATAAPDTVEKKVTIPAEKE